MRFCAALLILLTACDGEPANGERPLPPGDGGDALTQGDTAHGDGTTGDSRSGDRLAGDGLGGDNGAGDGAAGDGLAGDAPAPGADLERCGLDAFSWLPPASVGSVVTSSKEHDVDQVLLLIVQSNLESDNAVSLGRTPVYDVDVHSVRYLTQDRGQPIEATGMVVFPDVSSSTELPVILWLHGTSGANDDCAPSRNIDDVSGDTYQAALLLAIFASYGYIVVAPDYIGQKASGAASPELHPYLVGEATALASLDAVRAAQALIATETGGTLRPGRLAVWGASQGGHAAGFSVRFAPHYAPEFDIAAGVYAIPPSDLIGHANAALTQLQSATGNMVLLFSAAEQWYRVPNGMAQVFVPPHDAQLQSELMAACAPTTLDAVTTLDEVFTPAALAAAQTPGFGDFQPWACIARENSLTATSVQRLDQVPGLVILGADDSLVDPAIERAAFGTLCASGMPLSLLECLGAGHSEGFFFSIDDAFDFIEARLDGDPVTGACQIHPATTCSSTP